MWWRKFQVCTMWKLNQAVLHCPTIMLCLLIDGLTHNWVWLKFFFFIFYQPKNNFCNDGGILNTWFSFSHILFDRIDTQGINCQSHAICVQHILVNFCALVVFRDNSIWFFIEVQCRDESAKALVGRYLLVGWRVMSKRRLCHHVKTWIRSVWEELVSAVRCPH